MKISKIITKAIASAATGALLLSAVVSASTVKIPNMSGVSVQYANMVQAANSFDSSLGSLISDAFTKSCYTTTAIDNAISNANKAISAINNIAFYGGNNKVLTTGKRTSALYNNGNVSYVRDNGSIAVANSYLKAAQLSGGILFNLSSATTGDDIAKGVVMKIPTSEYYNTVTFNISTSLYSTGKTTEIVKPVTNKNGKITDVEYVKNSLNTVVDKLNKYVAFLNTVKAFDSAAGCYDTSNTTNNPSNTTNRPGNTTNRPGNTTNRPGRPDYTRDAVINVRYTRIKQGTRFVIMDGVTARDNGGRGADLTDKVTVSGAINTSRLGSYRITYRVTGANGRTVTETVTYQVVKSIYRGGRSYNKL